MTRWVLGLGVLVGLATVGCGDDGIDGLAARGTVEGRIGETPTGFRFHNMTNLVPDDEMPPDGTFGGHCTIIEGVDGPATAFDVAILRSRSDAEDLGGIGMREFQVQVEDVVDSTGVVTTVLGMRQYVGLTGLGSCSLVGSWVDQEHRRAGVVTDCVVENSDGESATLSADIEFQECTLR